jgi:allantoate deiminase
MSELEAAKLVLSRCDELASLSEERGRLTRRFATPAMRDAAEAVAGWMREAGLSIHRDAIGNIVGRREASGNAAGNGNAAPTGNVAVRGSSGSRTLLLGSHLDTVPGAGRYDGILGVLVAIAAVQAAGDLPFAVEVYGFADEEGARFGTRFLASGVVAGRHDPADLERRDADGVRLADALRAVGGDPAGLRHARRDPADVIGYCEVHIEQGPVLEGLDTPLGVVTGIAGQSGATVRFEGAAGHAGTVPMARRRDALAAAAEFILAVEAIGCSVDGLVATVARLSIEPGAVNVIAGAATVSLDVRHLEDSVRAAAVERLHERAGEIAHARRLTLQWRARHTPAVACDAVLTELMAAAAGDGAVRMPSGAGHDAAMMSLIAPVAMLFVRCAGGISHHPDESVTAGDVADAIEATTRFLRLIDTRLFTPEAKGDRP